MHLHVETKRRERNKLGNGKQVEATILNIIERLMSSTDWCICKVRHHQSLFLRCLLTISELFMREKDQTCFHAFQGSPEYLSYYLPLNVAGGVTNEKRSLTTNSCP